MWGTERWYRNAIQLGVESEDSLGSVERVDSEIPGLLDNVLDGVTLNAASTLRGLQAHVSSRRSLLQHVLATARGRQGRTR